LWNNSFITETVTVVSDPDTEQRKTDIGAELSQCLTGLLGVLTIEKAETLIQLVSLLQEWLLLQITLLNLQIKFLDPPIQVAQKYLALAQQFLQQTRSFQDQLPLEMLKLCPILDRVVKRATEAIKGPLKIRNPFPKLLGTVSGQVKSIKDTALLIDYDLLIANLQDLLSLKALFEQVKQIMADQVLELDQIKVFLEDFKIKAEEYARKKAGI